MKPSPVELKKILQKNRDLECLLRKAQENTAQLERIRQYLPADLAGQLCSVSLQGDRINLLVNSPAWANRMRFALPSLRSALGSRHQFKVKVSLEGNTTQRREKSPAKRVMLSSRNARAIRESAQSIEHAELREALQRLASHSTRIDKKD
jgi:hypothetical protein